MFVRRDEKNASLGDRTNATHHKTMKVVAAGAPKGNASAMETLYVALAEVSPEHLRPNESLRVTGDGYLTRFKEHIDDHLIVIDSTLTLIGVTDVTAATMAPPSTESAVEQDWNRTLEVPGTGRKS